MKHVMIWLVRLYQKYISPIKPSCCRFRPTCSSYAIEAFTKRGFLWDFCFRYGEYCAVTPFARADTTLYPRRAFEIPKAV